MTEEEEPSGVVKIGLYLSQYLEGVPNSKIFKLSQALYDSMSGEFEEELDSEETLIQDLNKEEIQELHKSLAEKNYTHVRDMIKEHVDYEEKRPSVVEEIGEEGEVPEEVFKKMKQDPSHEFQINEKVAVKLKDGRVVFGVIDLLFGDQCLMLIHHRTKSGLVPKRKRLSKLWHF